MLRSIVRSVAVLGALAGAAFAAQHWMRGRPANDEYEFGPDRAVSGPGRAVDHGRQAGVPPEHNDDYADDLDRMDADSFPASDPPATW